jgi:Ca2+-binding EF-hand superfamily protein
LIYDTQEDIKKIMSVADLDNNDMIDLDEFIVFMRATEWKLQLGSPGSEK